MDTDYEAIYRERAEDYDRLVRAEDARGELIRAIDAIASVRGAAWLDVGAGTGRVTRLLLDAGASRVIAFDRSAAMIDVARRRLAAEGRTGWDASVADARALPIADASVDHAVAGWVFGHLRTWAEDWRAEIGRALAEMKRAVRPGGAIVVIETLGTGREDPAPPRQELGEYYAWLESAHGMRRTAIRTDYAFQSAAEAAELTGFFFGRDLAARIRDAGATRLPECTGLWSTTRDR